MPIREMNREQIWLLPPTLDELVPSDHPARFVAEFVDALDREEWAKLGADIEGDPLGAPAYHPRALLSVWLYGFMTNVRSCRKLEAACRDPDTAPVADLLAAPGPQHPVEVLPETPAEHERAFQAYGADCCDGWFGGPGDAGGGRNQVGRQRGFAADPRCREVTKVAGSCGEHHQGTGGPKRRRRRRRSGASSQEVGQPESTTAAGKAGHGGPAGA